MKNIDQIVAEVEREEQASRAAALALHSKLNRQIDWIFEQLNTDVVKSKYNHPHCDRLPGEAGIDVSRGGDSICRLSKSEWGLGLEVYPKSGNYESIRDQEEGLRRIIQLLERHKRARPDV